MHTHTCTCCGDTWEHEAYVACRDGGEVHDCIRCWRTRYSDSSPAYGPPCPNCQAARDEVAV